jgi:hypothetical protein
VRVSSRGLNLLYQVDSFTGNGSTTGFTLTQTPYSGSQADLYFDGLFISSSLYTLTGTSLSFSTAPDAGTDILVKYLRSN